MIRNAEIKDLSALADFCEKCFYDDFSKGTTHKFDKKSVIGTLIAIFTSGQAYMAIYEDNGIQGAMVVVDTPSLTDVNHRKAVEIMWHPNMSLDKQKRIDIMVKLLEGMEEWAVARGIYTSHISIPVKRGGSMDLLKSKGYVNTEKHYAKELT